MNNFVESTFQELFLSTVTGFPKTTRRQYAIDPIKIVKLEWIPYLGLKTLYVKGLAQNTENAHEYTPIILFKDVGYSATRGKNYTEIKDNNGKRYIIKKIGDNEVLVRCNCKDFFWRGNYADYLDQSLYGRKRSAYKALSNRPKANPGNVPMLCKHIIKMHKVLNQSGIIA